MKKITLITDGACSGNPGPGGWAALLRYGDHEKMIGGYEAYTTNNRMELMAVIESFKQLKDPCEVDVITDSQYVKNGITTWIFNWKKNGWMNKQKEPVKNIDLWKLLDNLVSIHQVKWHWVRGHDGHDDNERVDAHARKMIQDNR